MKRDKTTIGDKLKGPIPDVHTCKGMQSDNGHHYCWFTGEGCKYSLKANCADYRVHIKPKERVYVG